ncbi:MAG: phospholipase C [Nitrososphaerales archaeon]
MKLRASLLAVVMALLFVNYTPVSFSSTSTPIQHIVIILQENHTFDNYFGTYPGLQPAYALDTSKCLPVNGTCVYPFNGDSNSTAIQSYDLGHLWGYAKDAYNHGKMNGFIEAQNGKAYPLSTMAYYTNYTVPDYWDLAQYYALNANFFSSALSYSWPNHLYAVAARDGGIKGTTNKINFDLTFPTIITKLQKAGIDWRYYQGGWDDRAACTNFEATHSSPYLGSDFNYFWAPLLDFPSVENNVATCHKLLNTNDLLQNISNGYLPQVTWVMPDKSLSEHPDSTGPNGLVNGQEYTADVINAISQNPTLWKSTAIFLSWDDWGGYYDHVRPVTVDKLGFGFRVPMILISPYANRGITYGSGPYSGQEDFSAILSTIESNWGLSPLSHRDAAEPPLWYMFNFEQTPLQPLILPTSSLAVYPYSTCLNQGLCQISSASPLNTQAAYAHILSHSNFTGSNQIQELD